jgi:membrane protein DedA with SNARE-associated domain
MEHLGPHLFETIVRHGYIAILIIMIIEEAGVPSPIPGDGLLLSAGVLASMGRLSFAESLGTVVLGALVGASVLYWVARRGGRGLVHRYGKWIRLEERRLDQLHSLFDRLGPAGPGVVRLIPGLRIYTSALAGLADISYPIFLFNVTWACFVWGLVFMLLGYFFGFNWHHLLHLSQRATILSLLVVSVAVLGYLSLHFRSRRQPPQGEVISDASKS